MINLYEKICSQTIAIYTYSILIKVKYAGRKHTRYLDITALKARKGGVYLLSLSKPPHPSHPLDIPDTYTLHSAILRVGVNETLK